MALQSSGPISLDDIQDEFGGTNPISIDEYYGADTGVPSSGTISFDDFYGTSASIPANITQPISASGFAFPPGTASASVQFTAGGNVTVNSGTNRSWHPNSTGSSGAIGNDYEIRVTLSSGLTPSGPTLGSWHALSTTRTWSLSRSSFGISTCSCSISIRPTGGSIEDTGTFSITASVDV